MKHSGVAITITSVTDLLAFGIGASSLLPALGTFCAYSAVGITAVFFNMASFFLAWLVIDQRRIDARRDGCICCWKKPESWTPNECSQKSFMEMAFTKYADVLLKIPVKIVIVLVTATILGVGTYGVTQLDSNFDFIDFFPKHSYVVEYFKENEKHFPAGGIQGNVYVAEVPKIEEKLQLLENLLETVSNVADLRDNYKRDASFLHPFLDFLQDNGIKEKRLNDTYFRTNLKNFLCSRPQYQNQIYYVGGAKLICTDVMTPPVRMMTFSYQHNL